MEESLCFWPATYKKLLPDDVRRLSKYLRTEFHWIPFCVVLRRELNAVEVTALVASVPWVTIESRLEREGFRTRNCSFFNLLGLCCRMIGCIFFFPK